MSTPNPCLCGGAPISTTTTVAGEDLYQRECVRCHWIEPATPVRTREEALAAWNLANPSTDIQFGPGELDVELS